MRTARASIAFFSLLACIAACDDDDDATPITPTSDAGGTPTTPDASGSGTPDASGTPMTDAAVQPDAEPMAVCEPGGEGEIVVEIMGLPAGLDSEVNLEGPVASDAGLQVLTESTTLADSASGDYHATALNVVGEDPLVRPLFTPAAPLQLFCLPDGESHTLSVNYQQVATSNKLWALNDVAGAALLSFSSAALSGTPVLDAGLDAGVPGGVSVDAVAGKDLAFDRDGHLWTFGPTTADPPLLRYRAAQFAGMGLPGFDRAIEINDIACLPALRAMASMAPVTCG
jgi:hypothetical protein